MERSNGPAALTSALLVRKGAALPAGYAALGASVRVLPTANAQNDESRPGHRSKEPADARTRISLRLDADRHLKLKLSAAHLHRSLQDLLINALDAYLEQVGPAVMNGKCACLEGECAARNLGCAQE